MRSHKQHLIDPQPIFTFVFFSVKNLCIFPLFHDNFIIFVLTPVCYFATPIVVGCDVLKALKLGVISFHAFSIDKFWLLKSHDL